MLPPCAADDDDDDDHHHRQQHRQPAQKYTMACICGKVAVTVADLDAKGPISASFCHCSICRRLSGAPFSANVLWPQTQVQLTRGSEADLQSFSSSKHVQRCRCTTCGSPILARLNRGKVIALPLASFANGVAAKLGANTSFSTGSSVRIPAANWAPQAHLHYSSRVVDCDDGLPKYHGMARGPLMGPSQPVSPAAAAPEGRRQPKIPTLWTSAPEIVPFSNEILELRQRVMWPNRALEYSRVAGDDDPSTMHFGVYNEGRASPTDQLRRVLCAVVSVWLTNTSGPAGRQCEAQFRKFCTNSDVQRRGIGSRLLMAVFTHLRNATLMRAKGGPIRRIWCNARVEQRRFYSKLGFGMKAIDGSEFEKGGRQYVLMERVWTD